MKTRYAILSIFIAGLFAEPVFSIQPALIDATDVTQLPSEGTPDVLSRKVRVFATEISQVNSAADAKYAQLRKQLVAGLETAVSKAQTAGNIDAVLALKNAMENLDGLTDSDVPVVKQAIEFRAKKSAEIEQARKSAALNAARVFNERLESTKKEETQKGNFETAKSIADYQKRLQNWARTLPVAVGMTAVPVTKLVNALPPSPVERPPATSPSRRIAVPSEPRSSASNPSRILSGTQEDISVTLSKSMVPYVVKGQYSIPEGKELIIKAGSTILFEEDACIYCEGSLSINGTETDPIICKGSTTKVGYWKGIDVRGAGATISFAVIRDAQTGIIAKGPRLTLKNCRLRNNENGIQLHYEGRPTTVENCVFDSNGIGIWWGNSHGSSVRNCSFLNNEDCGMLLWNPWPADETAAENCIFHNNRLDGIRGYTHSAKMARIRKCSFENNGRYDIDIGPFPSLDCRRNYWGPSTTRILQQRGAVTNLPNIKDGRDSGNDQIVDVADFLTEPPANCGATIRLDERN